MFISVDSLLKKKHVTTLCYSHKKDACVLYSVQLYLVFCAHQLVTLIASPRPGRPGNWRCW